MKIKSKITALILVALMLLLQVPFAVFAAETTTATLSPDTLENGVEDIYMWPGFYYRGDADIKSVEIIDGSLPDGLELDYIGLQAFDVKGTPKKAGEYHFTVKVTDKNGNVLTKAYTWIIDRDIPLEFLQDDLKHGYKNDKYTAKVSLTKDRDTKNKWELEDADGKDLPAGLKMDEDSGEISWETPEEGKYNLKITVTRKEKTLSKIFRLIIEPEGGCTHTNATKIPEKIATCRENGTQKYWYCDTCECNFYDEDCEEEIWKDPKELYTTAFHSDENDDGKCDTCDKTMPIFKKVTNEDEITVCGMYLVVSNIGGKYYTLNISKENYANAIEAVEIEQNQDGTFSYPESDTGIMILETELAAECGNLDAGKPRYSFGTTINGIPYGISSDDYSGAMYMYSYENSKYGYRMKLTDDKYVEIASVYAEYWSNGESDESGKGGSGILSAYEETADEGTKRYFTFATGEAAYPIELYKLTYAGEVDGQNYILSDATCKVTIDSEFTVLDDYGSKEASTVGGISEAVQTSYVESVISGQNQITGDVYATTYAEINLKGEESTVGEYATNINSLTYGVTPMIEVKGEGSEETYKQEILDDYLDGSEITVTLCVGNMSPTQIIHHKKDGTKEYFYRERSADLKEGQKTFSIDSDRNGNFVTFTVDSFSDIEILATAKAEEYGTMTTVSENGNKFTVLGNNIKGYTVILALYQEDGRLTGCKTATYNGKAIPFVISDDYTSAKVMVWEKFANITPVTAVEIVDLEQSN